MSRHIEAALGITPIEVITPDDKSVTIVPDGDEDSDHQYARARHYELSEKGSDALDIAMRVARESENPRAIEVLSGLIKTLSDVNKGLVTLNKDKAEAKTARTGKGTTPTVGTAVNNQTNIVFSGNSSELNKLLKDMKG